MECYYFGTFDPIHIGHIKISEAVKKKYNFNRVIFVPTPKSPFKTGQSDISDRLNMMKLVLRGDEISDIELKIPEPNYTYKTIQQIGKCYFIIGYDQFLEIEKWRETEYLKENLFFIVVPRVGANAEDFSHLKEKGYRFEILDMELINISSTEIRKNIAIGNPITGFVDRKVENYIYGKRLYSNLA